MHVTSPGPMGCRRGYRHHRSSSDLPTTASDAAPSPPLKPLATVSLPTSSNPASQERTRQGKRLGKQPRKQQQLLRRESQSQLQLQQQLHQPPAQQQHLQTRQGSVESAPEGSGPTMKFGKRLAAEAARRWSESYFDYKAVKKAIQDDVTTHDASGGHFRGVLLPQLEKVSAFYSERAGQLEAMLQGLTVDVGRASDVALQQLRGEIQELIKFTALNYLAVVKAIKKRNRHLQENFGPAPGGSLHALDLLGHAEFFTSARLASLATQAEVLQKRKAAASGSAEPPANQMLEEYQCPICLDTLHDPVVLTCAHRFCWGCLVAHCTASRGIHVVPGKLGLEEDRVPIPATPYYVLEQIAISEEVEAAQRQAPYNCPLCRKPQLTDVDRLQIDTNLSDFIETLKAVSRVSFAKGPPGSPTPSTASTEGSPLPRARSIPLAPWGVIPPQSPNHLGKLTVLLDLDGTLISSFTPRRAPRLPPSVRTHLVGQDSRLNPGGVFVVERPDLDQFLAQLSSWAEVIVFTAGLEDYAKPIIDVIDPNGKYFASRIYREGTLRTDYYQCVKDMSRLNRDLRRTVLVDDTPLAFLHQPNNGIPVLGFRGDPDDRLLLEAVLPLLQMLVGEPDVRQVLQKRFDMCTWFRKNGFPVDSIVQVAEEAAEAERVDKASSCVLSSSAKLSTLLPPSRLPICDTSAASVACSVFHTPTTLQPQPFPGASGSGSYASAEMAMMARTSTLSRDQALPSVTPSKPCLLLLDFDNTITDFDAGERVIEALAPELLPMLMGLECPANFVPLTNTLLAELQRRGVTRDKLLAALQDLGAHEVPAASVELLRTAAALGVQVKVLSDANSVFISHILAGAKALGFVQEVITNMASFEQVGPVTPSTHPATSSGSSCCATSAAHTGRSGRGSAFASSACQNSMSVSNTGHIAEPCDQASRSSSDASTSSCACGALGAGKAAASASHRLVITPHHPAWAPPHSCPRCPVNLCKGAVMAQLKRAGAYERVVFCGDGANDICAALQLGQQDTILARAGYPLAKYLESVGSTDVPLVAAAVRTWRDHLELQQSVVGIIRTPQGSSSAL